MQYYNKYHNKQTITLQYHNIMVLHCYRNTITTYPNLHNQGSHSGQLLTTRLVGEVSVGRYDLPTDSSLELPTCQPTSSTDYVLIHHQFITPHHISRKTWCWWTQQTFLEPQSLLSTMLGTQPTSLLYHLHHRQQAGLDSIQYWVSECLYILTIIQLHSNHD